MTVFTKLRNSRFMQTSLLGSPRSAVEVLEARNLFASAPAGFSHVATLTVDGSSDEQVVHQQIFLETGRKYFYIATGTHQIAENPIRNANAQFYQNADGNWVKGSGPHLHANGVNWWAAAAGEADVFTKQVTGNGANLKTWISDSYYGDNDGSLSLQVYEEIVLQSMTVTNADDPSETSTAVRGAGTPADLELGWDTFDKTNVTIEGVLSSTEGGYNAVFGIFSNGVKIADVVGGSAQLNWTQLAQAEVRGGVDKNGNGKLDAGEVQLQNKVQPKPLPVAVTVKQHVMQGYVNQALNDGNLAETKFRLHYNVIEKNGVAEIELVVEAWIVIDVQEVNKAIAAGKKDNNQVLVSLDGVYGHEQRHIENIVTELGGFQAQLDRVVTKLVDVRKIVLGLLKDEMIDERKHDNGNGPKNAIMYPSDPNKPAGALPAQPAANPPAPFQKFPIATGGVYDSAN